MSVPPLDPQVSDALRQAAEAGTPSVDSLSPDENRANYVKVAKAQFGEVDEVFAIEDRDADGVPVRIYRPVETGGPSPALVYFHGGGYVVGSVETHDGITRGLAKRSGCIVVSVDYRLAPEHPYPAALDDCWTAARWALANAAELGIDADRVGVGGDSVGGALAAIVARKGRDAGTSFAVQLLIYPVVDSRMDTQSYSLYESGYGLTREAMQWYWRQYIGDSEGSDNPDISPAALTDLRGLPRAIVVTAEADVLRDEAEDYAQRLFGSGIELEGYRYDGMIHGFLRMAGIVDRSRQALDEISESLAPLLERTRREDLEQPPPFAGFVSLSAAPAETPPAGA